MATYKEIKGVTVQTRDEDPDQNVGTWSAGGNANTARYGLGGTGIQTAALGISGYNTTNVTNVESYDGSTWTEVADVSSARRFGAAGGTYTSAFYAGGNGTPNFSNATEEYDGSSWTSGGNLGTGRRDLAGRGTQTAGIVFGGDEPPASNKTEEYDGSSWTAGGTLSAVRLVHGGTGTQTAALAFAGSNAFPTANNNVTSSEEYDGSSWTAGGNMNTARYFISGGGSQTSTLAFGGTGPAVPGPTTKTESYDGTSWTEVNDLAIARYGAGGAGLDNTSSLCFFGDGSPTDTETEEWNFPPVTQDKLKEGMIFLSGGTTLKGFGKAAGIPAGTWATGGTLNAGHGYGTGFGLQTAAVCCFGGYPTHTTNTETYNGTAWTEVNEGNTARRNLASFGILTSGLAFGGGPPFGVDLTESWNGTSWTEVNDLPTTVYDNRGLGASSASGLSVGGVDAATPGASKKANEWNGSSWTAISDMGTIRNAGATANAGIVTAGLVFGGEAPGNSVNTELWNGTSWTELNNLNTARSNAGGNGTSTSALCFGGGIPSGTPSTQAVINEFWNGTSWTELADLGTGLQGGVAPAGGAVAGLASGGQSAPSTQNTVSQEWTVPEANKTITVS